MGENYFYIKLLGTLPPSVAIRLIKEFNEKTKKLKEFSEALKGEKEPADNNEDEKEINTPKKKGKRKKPGK